MAAAARPAARAEPDAAANAAAGPPPWEKLLWRRQPYPDNHVDASFLSQLRMNAAVDLPSFGTIMLSSLGISQQIAAVLFFVAVFVHLYEGALSAARLVSLSAASALLLGGAASMPGKRDGGANARAHAVFLLPSMPSLAVLALALLALSPVLRTLTEATTSDSIWALTVVLFAGHLALADYSMRGTSRRAPLSATLSLTMAMCASVVLASRLTRDMDVFALLLFALHLFAIYPLLREHAYVAFGYLTEQGFPGVPAAAPPLTLVLVAAAMRALLPLSRVVALVVLPSSLAFVSIVCPLWMRRAQRWKRVIRGPWDEAVLPRGDTA